MIFTFLQMNIEYEYFLHFCLNYYQSNWLMVSPWPSTCPPNKSNQLVVESLWMFVPNVRKFPGGVSELLCSREWNKHMDDRTRRKHNASRDGDHWHKKKTTLQDKKKSRFSFYDYSFLICWHSDDEIMRKAAKKKSFWDLMWFIQGWGCKI